MPPRMPRGEAPAYSLRRVVETGLRTLVTAILVNIAISLVGKFIFDVPFLLPRSGAMQLEPLPIFNVIAATVVGVLGATAVFAIIAHFSKNPGKIFGIVATVVLIVTFLGPRTLPVGVGSVTKAWLMIMHVAAWASITIPLVKKSREF